MWPDPTRWLPVLLSLLAADCNRSASESFVDTEGRQFTSECRWRSLFGPPHECEIVSWGSAPRPTVVSPGDRPAFDLMAFHGRYLGVCEGLKPAVGGFLTSGHECRGVVCRADADCPRGKLGDSYRCLNGLCGSPAGTLDASDAFVLCLAGTGPWTDSPEQRRRAELARNCGTPCRVPTECRQP